MATYYSSSALFLPNHNPNPNPNLSQFRSLNSSSNLVSLNTTPSFFTLTHSRVRASTSSTFVNNTKPTNGEDKEASNTSTSGSNVLACPICYEPLTLICGSTLSVGSTDGSDLQCNSCKKTYSGNASNLDLTPTTGSKSFGESNTLFTQLFRSPLISFVYERGWRQNFIWGGFPGSEKEFEMMKDTFQPTFGGNIVDASCGSGLFTRLFAKSGLFSSVIALDYSEKMLEQCYDFIKQDETFPKDDVILVRADISRLPFVSRSIDAIHAGAAIHCWPSPTKAVAEISRVLRPGGVFVGTTFILDGPFSFVPFLKEIRQTYSPLTGNTLFLSESELEDICRTCGLVGFKCERNGRFIMYSATKPT
ncbi:hypothetical protein ACFE04_014933 [Oxalis oulophora]